MLPSPRSICCLPLWLLILAMGCKGPPVLSPVVGAAPPRTRDAGAAPSPLAPPALPPPAPAVNSPGVVAPTGNRRCAQEGHAAEALPLDLMLLIDRSGSMLDRVPGGQSKWQLTREALTAFMSDARSSGVSVGMQFFPQGSQVQCHTDADCGGAPNSSGELCFDKRTCVDARGVLLGVTCRVGFFVTGCPAGGNCVLAGLCSVTGNTCTGLGRPCPTGVDQDICLDRGKGCPSDPIESCNPDDYQSPPMAPARLPDALPALTGMMGAVAPEGATPTPSALRGVLSYVRARLTAAPDRRVALILLTDGLPTTCPDGDVAAVTAEIARARAELPGLGTYIIGVFGGPERIEGEPALAGWSAAAGTGAPFLLTPSIDLAERLTQALTQIRGAALACNYAVPAASGGTPVDVRQVGVHYSAATGEEDITYVARPDLCDPASGGWHYDIEPDRGTPTRVTVCPATCARFQADPSSKVELRFGCQPPLIE